MSHWYVFQKMKNLIRKRSGGNTGRLTRVLSQKSLNVTSSSPAPKSPPRTFLLETPVQFTTVSSRKFSYPDARRRIIIYIFAVLSKAFFHSAEVYFTTKNIRNINLCHERLVSIFFFFFIADKDPQFNFCVLSTENIALL